jgi:hypothetical protein
MILVANPIRGYDLAQLDVRNVGTKAAVLVEKERRG